MHDNLLLQSCKIKEKLKSGESEIINERSKQVN